MANPFPNAAGKPSQRNFTFGEYPVKIYRSLSGQTMRRSFGNKAYGATLEVSFENVSEAVLGLIYDHYHAVFGTTNGFELSSNILAGLTTEVADKIKAGNKNKDKSTLWYYQETPQVQSTFRSLSTIQITFVSELSA